MKLIIGLGNPGPEYAATRHNIGFMVVDAWAAEQGEQWKLWGPGKNAELIQASVGGEKVAWLKPLTFMNNSGQAAVAAAHFFKILPDEICVVHDELDLPFGDVRLKADGGDGGHNGLKSLTKHLSSGAYARVRMGVGRPPHPEMDPADYVLSPFARQELPTVEDMIQRGLRGITAFVQGPQAFGREMNSLNKRAKE